MKSRQAGNEVVRKELMYCEHCGALWARECGAGVVYCDNCRPKIADLPEPKKKNPGKITLPVGNLSVAEEYAMERGTDDELDLEAEGVA